MDVRLVWHFNIWIDVHCIDFDPNINDRDVADHGAITSVEDLLKNSIINDKDR